MAEKATRKPTKPTRKRQWQRPRVKTGQLFESNSLACQKSPADNNDQCMQGPFQQS